MAKWLSPGLGRKPLKRGITGLETAIVLIAFVIVASVFAFAVLNMGLLSTQRAGETVQAGMKQASSALQLSGSVIAYNETDQDTSYKTCEPLADKIEFYIKLAPGREPVDFSQGRLVISYTNDRVHARNIYDGEGAQITWIRGDGDDLLEEDEEVKITINLKAVNATYGSPSSIGAFLGPNEWFKVELKPVVGSVLAVERWMPSAIDPVMDLG